VSSRGGIQVTGQTVTLELGDTSLRVIDQHLTWLTVGRS
jgi:hypothetical protein